MELAATVSHYFTNRATLGAANTALVCTNSAVILVDPIRQAKSSLLTDLNTSASTLEEYIGSLSLALQPMGLEMSNIQSNTCPAKVILNGVPTHISNGPDASLHMTPPIKEAYSQIILCQVPRWLPRPETHQSRVHSCMDFAVADSWAITTLGVRYCTLFKRMFHLEYYVTINPDTPCHNCQSFRHYQ